MSIYSLTPEDEPLFESLKQLPYDKTEWKNLPKIASWNDFGGFTGMKHTDETKELMRQSHLGYNPSAETRKKISDRMMGRPQTPGRAAALAELNAKPRSLESNAKRSAALKGKSLPRVTCPHCGTSGSAGNIARWHGINCKAYTQPSRDNQ